MWLYMLGNVLKEETTGQLYKNLIKELEWILCNRVVFEECSFLLWSPLSLQNQLCNVGQLATPPISITFDVENLESTAQVF